MESDFVIPDIYLMKREKTRAGCMTVFVVMLIALLIAAAFFLWKLRSSPRTEEPVTLIEFPEAPVESEIPPVVIPDMPEVVAQTVATDAAATGDADALMAQAKRKLKAGDHQAARAAAWQRLPRAEPVQPPAPYPEDSLTYLANVFNHAARDFYAQHGVKVIDAAYESHEEEGEVSLMITKHCVRFSLSLCPKQAKGVIGVKGTVKAEPLQLVNGKEKLTLRFDCKPCEMHVVGKIKRGVMQQGAREAAEHALRFYRRTPVPTALSD